MCSSDLNSVLGDLPVNERVQRGGFQFNTKKYRTETHIVKDIQVEDAGEVFAFQEKVRIFSFDELVQLHQKAGLEVINVYGDYGLGDFETNSSPRIVLVSRKS